MNARGPQQHSGETKYKEKQRDRRISTPDTDIRQADQTGVKKGGGRGGTQRRRRRREEQHVVHGAHARALSLHAGQRRRNLTTSVNEACCVAMRVGGGLMRVHACDKAFSAFCFTLSPACAIHTCARGLTREQGTTTATTTAKHYNDIRYNE